MEPNKVTFPETDPHLPHEGRGSEDPPPAEGSQKPRLKSISKDPNKDPNAVKKKASVRFESTEGTAGDWKHLPKKTHRFDFEDRRKGKDRHFHINIATECETYFEGQRIRQTEKKMEHFAFIVDLDEYEYHKVVFHSFLNEILQSTFFRVSILILVLINAVLIGLQTSTAIVQSYSTVFHVIDQIILSVFLFEIFIKWIYDFRLFWKVHWNILDFTIVFLIILAAVVPTFGNSRALIVVRVVRAFRSLRSVSFLSSLSVVTHTIIKSFADMANILLVLMIFMLVMSVMGVILFDLEALNTKRFLSALDAWFVLFVCVTQDGWNQILDEFREPKEYFPLLAIYLIFAVSIGAFVFANLIVAVIVANLELSVKELREERKMSDNPLEFHQSSENELEIQPVYDLLCKHNVHIFAQRPLRIPNLHKFSTRRIQAYISLIVALEQNMLEAEIIHIDVEKIMAVMLSIILQLEIKSQQKADEDELKRTWSESLAHAKKIDGATNLIPEEPNKSGQPQTKESKAQKLQKAKSGKTISKLPEARGQQDNLSFLQVLKNRNSAEDIQHHKSSLRK